MKKFIANLLKEHSIGDIILGIIFYTAAIAGCAYAYYTLISLVLSQKA